MNFNYYKYLESVLKSALLTSVSLLTLSSCEVLPDDPSTYNNPLLEYQEYLCAALRMDESYFDIEATKGKGFFGPEVDKVHSWYALKLKNIPGVELEILNNPRDFEISIHKLVVGGKEYTSNSYNGRLIQNPFHYSVIERDFCERVMLKNVKNPYSKNIGVPTKALNFSRPVLMVNSKKPVLFDVKANENLLALSPNRLESLELRAYKGIKTKEVRSRVDWESVQEMNLQAFDVWENLRERYSDEEIREKYFSGTIKEIEDFKESLSLALETTHFETTYNQRLVSHYHPLLSQILIDLFIANNVGLKNRIASVDKEVDYKRNGVSWANTEGVDFIIGNKTPGRFRQKSSGRTFVGDNIEYSRGYTEDSSFKETLKLSNTIVLLQTLSHRNCYEWGLRPEITRFLIPYRISGGDTYINNQNYRDHRGNRYEDHIANSVMAACGDTGFIRPSKSKDYFVNLSILGPYISSDQKRILDDSIKRAKR